MGNATRRAHATTGMHSVDTIAQIMRDFPPVIYAFRCHDGMIKIGYSAELNKRRMTLKFTWADLLGFMPGTIEDERALHRRLAPSLARGSEYYHATSDVLDVVDEMRSHYRLAPLSR